MHGSHTLFEKPSLTRAEAEIKKKELEDKTQKSGGPKRNEGGALTFTAIQVPEILEAVCVHFGIDTHPVCDKCQMRHNPAGGCVKAELAMKAFELSGPIVKSVAQAELTVKNSVSKAKEKELRSSDVKVLETLAKEISALGSSLNKMFQQAESGRGPPRGKDNKAEYAKSRDCHKWLNGECNRKDCIFKHDPSKKDAHHSADKPDSSSFIQ